MAVAFVGVLGALIGSFLNVVVYRVPAGKSIVSPPSACPQCGASIRPIDNLPIISWLVLRGRCRDCASTISARYPLVELGTALAFVAVAVAFLPAAFSALEAGDASLAIAHFIETVAFLYFAAISVSLALIDIDTHTLPNRIVLPSYIVGAVLLVAAALASGDWMAIIRAASGMAGLFVFYLALALVKPGAMGFGDVKLAGVIGLYLGYLGWGSLIVGAFAAFIVGGLASVVLLLLRRVNRKGGIPFGPWMVVGAWVGVFFGEGIADWYLALIGIPS